MAETDFWQALSDTIHRAVNLRVITLVGDASVSGPLERLDVSGPGTASPALVTDINLVGGDITRIVSEKLLTPDFADLRAAHQDAVKQAQDIVARNIAVLTTVAKELGDKLGALPPPSGGPARGPGLPTPTPTGI